MSSCKPEKIIVRAPNWIGDHVMAMGFYRNLRLTYPDAKITWLIRESLQTLKVSGLANEVIVLPKDAGILHFARKLASAEFDLSISLPATLSSALLFFLSRIPERTGFSADGNSLFYTSYLPWKGREARKHKTELYLELFEFITGEKAARPKIVSNTSKNSKKIIVAPGASIPLREWPYFETLIDPLMEKFPEHTLTFVGAGESKKWHEILTNKKSNRIVDLIEKTSLDSLVDECRTAAFVIANDSGVGHLAATLAGAKTYVLFGPGDPDYIMPQGDVVALQPESISCSPCEKPYCRSPHGHQACLKSISVKEVVEKLLLQ